MANADRISELYKGEIWDASTQRRARDRIHWMARQARGRVLDVGCSQGIAALLVARSGLDVLGVDVELDRLAYAEADRVREPLEVARRVAFTGASVSALPFGDDSFDTVLLGQVLEYLNDPGAALDEVARVLRPGGVVAITVPFGLRARPDHRHTFHPVTLLELVGGHLRPESLELVDRDLLMVATSGVADASHSADLLVSVQPAADRVLLDVERAEHDSRDATRELARRSRQLAERDLQVGRLTATVARAEDRLEVLRARMRELTFQRDKWRWQFESLKNRRPLRVLVELRRALREPARLLRLPATIAGVLRGPVPGLPVERPERSEEQQALEDQRRSLEFQMKLLAPAPAVTLRDLRVAGVLDTFSASCFGAECDLVTFRPDNWEAVLTKQPPHLLLVESAWQGNGGAWQYQVGSYTYPESVGLPHLVALTAWCRERGIPTVFWNKEDPVHFDKFTRAAELFDVVLTSDADCISRYQALPGLRADVVEALPFAAQPRLHNPIAVDPAREPVPVFGGTYYRNRHPERRAQMEALLDAATGFGLIIFDRTFGQESDSLGFPERFAPHIRGGLPYDEMVAAYKRYRVFLNANSVQSSPTMFSRRVFELLACGTPVVSTPSVGMRELFGDIVAVIDDTAGARVAIERLLHDDALWRQRSAAGIRRVHGEHTYAHRLSRVARLAGYDIAPYEDERVAVLVVAADDEMPAHVVDSLIAQSEAPHDVVVGVASGAASGRTPDGVTVVGQKPDRARAQRFADLAAHTDAPWVLIADGAHSYRLDHLADLAVARRWTHADVIGAPADPGLGSPGDDLVAHRYVARVQPHGALVRVDLVAAHGWDDGAPDPTQARLAALGATFYTPGA